MPPLTPEKIIMADLLGTVDVVFSPMRGPFVQRRAQVRYERRVAWRTGGLPLRTSGANTEKRKLFEVAVRQLESAGLLQVARGDAGRRTHARLTDHGEMVARVLAATGNVYDDWPLFEHLARLSDAVGGDMVAEHVVCGISKWKGTPTENHRLALLELQILPFIVADLVNSSGDIYGRFWYSITAAGRLAMEAGRPAAPPADLKLDEPFADRYDRTRKAAERELEDAEPEVGSSVIIPVSAGVGWGTCPKELLPLLKKGSP